MLRVVVLTVVLTLMGAHTASARVSCADAGDSACDLTDIVDDGIDHAKGAVDQSHHAATLTYDSAGACKVNPNGGVSCSSTD